MDAVPHSWSVGGVAAVSSCQAIVQIWPPWQVVLWVGEVVKIVASALGMINAERARRVDVDVNIVIC